MENKWTTLGVTDVLVQRLTENGIVQPTAVQEQTIPLLLEGKDISAGSQTGTGKTLAYLLPLLQRMDPDKAEVQTIILSPTQELAMQIVRVAEHYAEPLGIRVQQLIGGAALKRQVEKLRLHPQLIVGTPGRLHELLKIRKLKLSHVQAIVVDEADQVFQLGSINEIETLFFALPRTRQTVFFSATYPATMSRMEGRWMKEPLRIDITPKTRVSETISQFYVVCDKRDKTDTTRRIVRLLEPSSALLFLNDTDQIANWESKLRFEGFSVETLYGDADKQRRAATLSRFREGQCQLLLATDVAARGLDIEGLPLVINLDPAPDADHYVHRAGRTGRMGKPGMVVNIVTYNEVFIMDKFRKTLGIDLPEKAMYKGEFVSPSEVGRRAVTAGKSSLERTSAERRPSSGRASNEPRGSQPEARQTGNDKKATATDAAVVIPGRGPKASSPSVKNAAAKKPTVKSKKQLEREKKDKGAPKWLKAKRNGGETT